MINQTIPEPELLLDEVYNILKVLTELDIYLKYKPYKMKTDLVKRVLDRHHSSYVS